MRSGQPVIFQKFNTNRQALQTFLMVQATDSMRVVYTVSDSGNLDSVDFSTMVRKGGSGKCNDYSQTSTFILSDDKGSSTLDINGDCQPDLVLESTDRTTNNRYMEFYMHTADGFCLVETKKIGADYLMASFADLSKRRVTVDKDGANDLILMTKSAKIEIYISNVVTDVKKLCSEKPVTLPFLDIGVDELNNVTFIADVRTSSPTNSTLTR